jgi:hypothetical protein
MADLPPVGAGAKPRVYSTSTFRRGDISDW